MKPRFTGLGVAALVCLGSAAPLTAQDSLLAELAQRFRSRPLSLGALLQVVGDYQNTDRAAGVNGFRVANFRLKLSGELDGGYGYGLQTNFAAAPAILDAELHYRLADALVLQAGQFKAPFSRELLTGAGDLDFIDRARIVSALAPSRQMGVQARGRIHGRLEYGAGAFNGNGIGARLNDDGRLMGVARASWWPLGFSRGGGRSLELGANLAYSRDGNVNLGSLVSGFEGRRTVWGMDLRFTDRRWLVAGEIVGARLAALNAGTTRPKGWQATIGFQPTPRLQLLARWDALRGNGLAADGNLLVLGVRTWPTGAIQLRVNDAIDLAHARPARHRIQAGAQLGF